MNFEDFNFEPVLNEALSFMGFEKPTPVQEQGIPIIFENRDLIACAQTGTGKTAAFLLPMLNKLAAGDFEEHVINVLIVVPTRELAQQIDQQIEAFGYFVGASSLAVYGGGKSIGWDQQKKALTKGADIIIATPGRLISHLSMGYVDLSHVKHFILDEADRMLDMGFFDDLMSIVKHLPEERQNLLFSATMPDKIRTLAKKTLKNPEQISIAVSKPATGVLQGAYLVYENQKLKLLKWLLKGKKNYPSILIFTSTKKKCREIAKALSTGGFNAKSISSDLEQHEREQVMRDFISRSIQVLVATDILSRGIDIKDINLIINYDVPQDAEDYVHRVGRTARADATGVALTLVSETDQGRLSKIEKFIEQEIRKMKLPEFLGEAPKYKPFQRRESSGRRNFRRNPGRKRKR